MNTSRAATRCRPLLRLAAMGVVVLPALAMSSDAGSAAGVVRIEVLSNRADLVSGGDALVEIVLPDGTGRDGLVVADDGRDVTSVFDDRDGHLVGLVGGLDVGVNVLTATLPDGRGARIEITNHPRGGPLFAGPQVHPWFCDNAMYGLEPARDVQCNTNVRYEFQYMSTAVGQFLPYDPAAPPGDVASTTTVDGVTVPYIVRLETGVMNRSGYEIAVLFDPEQPWDPYRPQSGWAGRVLIPFEGGCSTMHTSSSTGYAPNPFGAMRDPGLRRGFLVMMSSLNMTDNNCNQWVSAETVVMLKEYVREQYGPIRHTISKGCSGGSTQQYHMANNYPGVIDGLIPGCSFPDLEAAFQMIMDCRLMVTAMDAAPHLWASPTHRSAVTGFPLPNPCRITSAVGLGLDQYIFDPAHEPSCLHGFFSGHPDTLTDTADWNYDPETNPTGARCTAYDFSVAIWGHRPASSWTPTERAIGNGFANRPYDNVGVQYGLTSLQQGELLPEQFVDLNSRMGGRDIDFEPTIERTRADAAALPIAHRTGAFTDMVPVTLPIINIRPVGHEEIHPDAYSFSTRARLDAAHGHHDNHVMWREVEPLTFGPGEANAIGVMDEWLVAIEEDTRDVPYEQKVAANKPTAAVDSCLANGEVYATGDDCHATLPSYSSPRIVAGGPMANNVAKCQLVPLDRTTDYGPLPFTDDQWARLEAAFPDGVCDWSKPSIGQQPSIPWLDFTNGTGGEPMGSAPVSVPFGSAGTHGVDGGELPATGGGAVGLVAAALFGLGLASRRRAPGLLRRPVSG